MAQCSRPSRSATVPRPGTMRPGSSSAKRLEHESALVQTRVRDREARLVDDLVAVEEQVEIDRPRAVAWAVAGPAERALDLEQRVEQLPRAELGLDCGRALRNARLVVVPPRFRLPERGNGNDDHALAEQLERPPQRRLAVAEVRAEADVAHEPQRDLNRGSYIPTASGRVELEQPCLPPSSPLSSPLASPALVASQHGPSAPTLVQLAPRAACADAATLRRAGATVVAPELRLYRLRAARAERLEPGSRARDALQTMTTDRPAGPLDGHEPPTTRSSPRSGGARSSGSTA